MKTSVWWYSSLMAFLLAAVLLLLVPTCIASQAVPDTGQLAIIEPLLLVSTLDGGLYAVGKRSGLIKWSIQEEPIVKLPQLPNVTDSLKQPLFLPDPKDGSLYIYNGVSSKTSKSGDKESDDSSGKDALQKMPFTISELVTASPCRSSDGFLYTGRKVDSWITLNAKTGAKMEVLDSDTPMCPSKSGEEDKNHEKEDSLFLGKSEYHLSIFDLKTREKRWNITLIDYSASASLAIPQAAYDLLHLTSSSSGRIVTIDLSDDKDSHKLLWSLQLNSPIVAVYQYGEGAFAQARRVPFTTVGDPLSRPFAESLDEMFPSLYIGESESSKSAYALSALVDPKETHVLSFKRRKISRLPLIEGPIAGSKDAKSTIEEYFNFLIYGYYEFPEFTNAEFSAQPVLNHKPKNLLQGKSGKKPFEFPSVIAAINLSYQAPAEDEDVNDGVRNLLPLFLISLLSVASSVSFGVWFHLRGRKANANLKLDAHSIRVGKITFDMKAIIGRGSAGTCVYKGCFEEKQLVAVKRIITDYVVLADREIELLRTLQHPNLVRYFATESDDLFRYIAIELADMSLADYVEAVVKSPSSDLGLKPIEILLDSCLGLGHLHSVNVIHRDIKPQNILISSPLAPLGRRKVLISDFGVSKVLSHDTSATAELVSTTRVIKGTEGWIAPEVLKSKLDGIKDFKTDKPVDIFSMGCLFYYVFTNGKHPFGDSLERQANILRGQVTTNELEEEEEDIGKLTLIQAMITPLPADRPTIETILHHPIFWSESKQLQFFQDLSDRIEKESYDSDVVSSLERGGFDVVKGDWRRFLSIELQTDLRKFRAYRGSSVRDLLRALRNKRHHYRELPEDVQESLGAIPDEFVGYFTSRFPRLLYHTYIAMQLYKFEPIFKTYYDQEGSWEFSFPQLPRTGIRWFDMHKSPKKDLDGGDEAAAIDELEISLKPNGFSGSDISNWRSCTKVEPVATENTGSYLTPLPSSTPRNRRPSPRNKPRRSADIGQVG